MTVFVGMSNRIAAGIERYEQRIKNNEKGASKEELDKLFKTLDADTLEMVAYFDANARAFAMGRLSLEESNQIYNTLKRWPEATLAERITITQVMKELMSR